MTNYYVIREQIEMARWKLNSKATIPLWKKKKISLAIKKWTKSREWTTEQWYALPSLSELCVIYTIKANANTSPMTWTHLKGFKNNQNVMLHSFNSGD
jgi:hypothetical protein